MSMAAFRWLTILNIAMCFAFGVLYAAKGQWMLSLAYLQGFLGWFAALAWLSQLQRK